MKNLQSVAVALAQTFDVFPCLPGRKEPATVNGFNAATRSIEKVEAWWRVNPELNPAISTGSGLIVLDPDESQAVSGMSSLIGYAHSQGLHDDSWLETYTVATPRGGKHLYYTIDPTERLGNRAGILPGVDVRGDGGYVLAPYAKVQGREYRPQTGYQEQVRARGDGYTNLVSFTIHAAPLPEWLWDLLTRPQQEGHGLAPRGGPRSARPIQDAHGYLEAVLEGERIRLANAQPGTRNQALHLSAYRLGKHVSADRLTQEEAMGWLVGTATTVMDPDLSDRGPLSEAEILATVRSGLQAGVRHGF